LAAFISMLVICFRKIMPTVYLASGLIATTRVSELVCALQKLRLPQSVIITLAVTLRFFPTVKEEFDCIRDAMRLRGIGLTAKNILTRPLSVMECVFVPLIMRCAQIADELSAAAVVRGIDSTAKRSTLLQIALRPVDALVAAAFTALGLLSVLSGLGVHLNFVEAYGF
jgi:energy-coupling factor transport system permease protein